MYSKFGPQPYRPRKAPRSIFTPRQSQILVLICKGYTSREIADKLSLGYKTVDTHRQQMMERANLHSISRLIMCAIEHGYYRPPGIGVEWPTIYELQEYFRQKTATYLKMRKHSLRGPLSDDDQALVNEVIEGICRAMTVEPTRGLAPKEEVEVDG